jgi:hypothetical protein
MCELPWEVLGISARGLDGRRACPSNGVCVCVYVCVCNPGCAHYVCHYGAAILDCWQLCCCYCCCSILVTLFGSIGQVSRTHCSRVPNTTSVKPSSKALNTSSVQMLLTMGGTHICNPSQGTTESSTIHAKARYRSKSAKPGPAHKRANLEH